MYGPFYSATLVLRLNWFFPKLVGLSTRPRKKVCQRHGYWWSKPWSVWNFDDQHFIQPRQWPRADFFFVLSIHAYMLKVEMTVSNRWDNVFITIKCWHCEYANKLIHHVCGRKYKVLWHYPKVSQEFILCCTTIVQPQIEYYEFDVHTLRINCAQHTRMYHSLLKVNVLFVSFIKFTKKKLIRSFLRMSEEPRYVSSNS